MTTEEENRFHNAAMVELIDHCVKSGSTTIETYDDWEPRNVPGTTVVVMVLRDVENKLT